MADTTPTVVTTEEPATVTDAKNGVDPEPIPSETVVKDETQTEQHDTTNGTNGQTEHEDAVNDATSEVVPTDSQADTKPESHNGDGETNGGGEDPTRTSRDREGEEGQQEAEQLRKLFIGGLTYNTTEADLREHFGKYGEIVDAVVMIDPQTRKSRCFGFVTYAKSTMVDEAQKNRPHVIHERTVEPKRAIPREMSSKPGSQATVCKAFVGGIKEGVEESDLREYFSKFGTITSVDIITEKGSSKRRGFAFVTFEDYDAVDKLTLIRNHNMKGFRLEVQKAVSKEEMGKESYGGGGSRGGSGGGDRDSYRDRDRGYHGGGGGGYSDRDRGGYDRGYDRGGRDDRGYRGGSGRDDGDRYSGYGSRAGSGGGGYGGDSSYGSRGSGGGGWQPPMGGGGGGGGGYSGYGGGGGSSSYAPPPAPYSGGGGGGGGHYSSGGPPTAGGGTAYPNYGGDYGRYGGAPGGSGGYGAPSAGGYGGPGADYGDSGAGGPIRNAYANAGGAASRPSPYGLVSGGGGAVGGGGGGGYGGNRGAGSAGGNYGRR